MNSNTNFTPGPWEVSKRPKSPNEHGAFSIDLDAVQTPFTSIISVWQVDDEESPEEIATANLVSAAPDMYTALQPFAEAAKRFLERYEEPHSDNTQLTPYFIGELNFGHLRALLTALGKAEGTNK